MARIAPAGFSSADMLLIIQGFHDACRETELLAELMYHGLTTGAGVQTLGEEYCDILQASGRCLGPSQPQFI